MGNKKKEEEERRERERRINERGKKEDGKIRRFTVCKHENHRETSTRRCESTPQGARITLAKNVLPRATRHVPLCVYSFCIAHDGLNGSPEVSRSLRHLIFIRSRKQCRANRCQLRHSGFWLSSRIIAGGNRCLANKLRMNHS